MIVNQLFILMSFLFLKNIGGLVILRWPHKVGPDTRVRTKLALVFLYPFLPLGVGNFYAAFFCLYSIGDKHPNFLLFFLRYNILWILQLFILSVRMNRICVRNIFLVLIFQRSFPLASCLSSCLFWTWIGWYPLFLILMYIDLFDMPSLDLSGIFFFLYFYSFIALWLVCIYLFFNHAFTWYTVLIW